MWLLDMKESGGHAWTAPRGAKLVVFGGAKLPTMQLCHVVSDKHGGPATLWNLRLGCQDCNLLMGPQNFFSSYDPRASCRRRSPMPS